MITIEPAKRYRSIETIAATIDAQQRFVAVLIGLATDYMDLDTRPLVCDGTSIQRIGAIPIPEQLQELLREEQGTLALLNLELRDAFEREYPRSRQ